MNAFSHMAARSRHVPLLAASLASLVLFACFGNDPASPEIDPRAPTNVQAHSVPGEEDAVIIKWTPASVSGKDPYSVYSALDSASGKFCYSYSMGDSCKVSGLTLGTTYRFRVSGSDTSGVGPSSLPVTFVPAPVIPGTPELTASNADSGKVRLTWTAPRYPGLAWRGFLQMDIRSVVLRDRRSHERTALRVYDCCRERGRERGGLHHGIYPLFLESSEFGNLR